MSNDVEPVGRAQFGMLLWVLGGLLILQVAGAIHSGFLFRRWKRSPDRRPKAPWKKWGWHLSLPLLGNLALAGICLVALPYAFGLHLTGMRMYAPDAALLAIIGGVWALVWGIGRTGWCLRLIRATVDDAPPMVPSAARDREPVPPTITR
jgi:hypothetical protein